MLRSDALRDQEGNKEHKKKMDVDALKHGVAYCLFRAQIYSAHKKNGNFHSKSSKVDGKISKYGSFSYRPKLTRSELRIQENTRKVKDL